MIFAEIENNRVCFVGETEILPVFSGGITAVEVPEGVTVAEGDVYESGQFRSITTAELYELHLPIFNEIRNRLFAETEWIRQRHEDRLALGIDDTANWTAWLNYWQALRDMPDAAGFDPAEPEWPTQPE